MGWSFTGLPREVYAIQHVKTGRIYVGSSKNVESRIKAHLSALKNGTHPNELLQEDYNDNPELTFYILDVIKEFNDPDREYEWTKRLKTYDKKNGYNYKDPRFNKKELPFEFSEGVPKSNAE